MVVMSVNTLKIQVTVGGKWFRGFFSFTEVEGGGESDHRGVVAREEGGG